MIYLDTSVALAQLLAEDRRPTTAFWAQTMVSSQLLEYEIWTRINAMGLTQSHGEEVRLLIGRLALAQLAPPVLSRALQPFPTRVRTLDALHLATAAFLLAQGQTVEFATYDDRQREAAKALNFGLYLKPDLG